VDLRERVVRAVEAGASRRATADKFEVSVSFVVKLMQGWRARGTQQPDRIGGWKRSTLAAHTEWVRALVAAEPDLTIAELQSRLTAEGIAVGRSSVGPFLVAAGLTQKKDGRARRGARVVAAVPHSHWKITTFLAALRHDGLSAPSLVVASR
jgi:transposase